MTDIKMLPLPDELRYRYGYMGQAEHDATVGNYARANVAHATAAKDAEIERLRAEVAMLREDARRNSGCMWRVQKGYTSHCQPPKNMREALARAERLAEALHWYVENDDTNEGQEGNEFWLAGRDRAITVLRDNDKEGKEAFWPKLPESGGPDWTGHD